MIVNETLVDGEDSLMDKLHLLYAKMRQDQSQLLQSLRRVHPSDGENTVEMATIRSKNASLKRLHKKIGMIFEQIKLTREIRKRIK